MDPYLESPKIWRGVHHWLITEAGSQLQPQLNKRGYYVDIESRIWVERPGRLVYPDVAVLQAKKPGTINEKTTSGTLVADEPVRLQGVREEIRENYLQIYDSETGKLITGIEFISPSNKADEKGRRLYLRKRRKFAAAKVNVVEIDLLREGKPLVCLPETVLKPVQPGKYVINVLRGGSLDYEFYPVELRSRLPKVGIPLESGEPDVVLDLQAAVEHVYEAGAYQMRIDYNQEPVPPFSETDSTWADEWLIARGVRAAH
jgi:hypothetical protein